MFLKRLFSAVKLLFFFLLLIVLMAPEWPAFQDERYRLDTLVGQRHFDFLVWGANALAVKGEAALVSSDDYLDAAAAKALVLDYLDRLNTVRRLEAQIAAVYADPSINDPDFAARDEQNAVREGRAYLKERQPIVESIIQSQVATVLAEEGFDLLGSVWPPVEMHMTPLPFVLVVSPREEIRQIYNIPLEHGLTVVSREELEMAVYNRLDRSALVVPIGGLGFYPAMIIETGSINYLVDVVAHEWAHHWLTLHPLGWNYLVDPALRTMNETVASIVGTEVGARVIERYYPEFVPLPEAPEGDDFDEEEQPAFDFNSEMTKTRVQVDALLAEGRVGEAERYMEERRQLFWDNGYQIRKLNQAYFAFYGAYADVPGGSGADPIGPALLALRENSPSLRAFMDFVAPITSFDELMSVSAGSAG